MKNDENQIDDGCTNDFFWHALNYRTAGAQHAEGMWTELCACVDRMVAAERERMMAGYRGILAASDSEMQDGDFAREVAQKMLDNR